MKKTLIEVCAASVQSALNAQQAGAHRIELCSALELGGITPSAATIELAHQFLAIDICVLIRPRPGDFFYAPLEFETIKKDILFCKNLAENSFGKKITGVVIGMLNNDSQVNMHQLAAAVALASPMQVTFHRAFDRTPRPMEALEKIIDAGAHRILTSGQKPSAINGKILLEKLITKANGRISIMPGAGIHAGNIAALAKATNAYEFHLSGKSIVKSPLTFQNEISDNDYFETDIEKIRQAVEAMKKRRDVKF